MSGWGGGGAGRGLGGGGSGKGRGHVSGNVFATHAEPLSLNNDSEVIIM